MICIEEKEIIYRVLSDNRNRMFHPSGLSNHPLPPMKFIASTMELNTISSPFSFTSVISPCFQKLTF